MIRAGRLIAACVLLLSAEAAVAAAKPAHRAAAKTDWSRTFSVTPAGGYRVGKPTAKVAIVEYGSLTCPHCRHFAEMAVKPLMKGYVRTGKASYEFRSLILDRVDLAATLVARCNGPARFFPMADYLYANQPAWAGKYSQLSQDDQDRIEGLPQGDMMLALAKVSGLFPIAASHGIPSTRAQTCLKSEKMADGLMQMVKGGEELGVKGTPTFFVNGKQVPAYDWNTLEPFLKEAGR